MFWKKISRNKQVLHHLFIFWCSDGEQLDLMMANVSVRRTTMVV